MKLSALLPLYRIIFGLLLITAVPSLQAATLGLTPNYPDFTLATDQIYTYDANCDGTFTGHCSAGQGKLTINGTISTYTEVGPGGVLENVQVRNAVTPLDGFNAPEAFSLSVIMDIAGETVVSGSFTLDGVVAYPFPTALYDGFSHSSGHLLSGDLALFGFSGDLTPSTGGILEFTFDNAGGFIADPLAEKMELGFKGYTSGGMILTVSSSSLAAGTFGANVLSTDWTGTGFGNVYVPVPAAAWLFGSGLIALFGLGRKKIKIYKL